MKKGLFRIIIPMMILAVWMIMCYPVCAKADGFDYFLYWIMVGCPYGIRKMSMFLVPKNFGIAGSIGILALDCIIGGLIGGMIVMIRIINTVMEIIKLISGTFGHNVQKWKGELMDCQHFFRQIFLGYFPDIVQAFDTLGRNVYGDDYTSLHNPIVLSSVLLVYGMFHSTQILF